MSGTASNEGYDLFICHASEDKEKVVRPLTQALLGRGLRVWLDELELTIGDSLHGRIDSGLARSRFGVVVFSRAFFSKDWPQRELAGLAARERAGTKVILPVWHEVDHEYIVSHSPILADRIGATTNAGIDDVAEKIVRALERSTAPEASDVRPSPAPPTTAPARTNQPRRLAIVAATLAIAGGSFALVPSGSSKAGTDSLPNNAANPSFEISYPAGWQHSATLAETPSVQLKDPITLRSTHIRAAFAVGETTSTSPTLLPEILLRRLGHAPTRQTVSVGKVTFLRFADLQVPGQIGLESVYALATSAGVILGVCLLPEFASQSVDHECDLMFASIQPAATRLTPGPQHAYAVALHAAITQLNAARSRDSHALSTATTPTGQAEAATQLAEIHEQAARSLRNAPAGAAEHEAAQRVVSALERASGGYAAAAAAARGQNTHAFDRARGEVGEAEGNLARSLSGLSDYGYSVER
jgi:hypothetical protein